MAISVSSAPGYCYIRMVRLLARIFLAKTVRALCVFAVNSRLDFHREDAKDAKWTL